MAIAATIGAAVAVGCSDVYVAKHANRQAAADSGAIARGWVPDIAPFSATEIEECHNLDTGQMRGTFKFQEQDESSFRRALGANVPSAAIPVIPFKSCRLNWPPGIDEDLVPWIETSSQRGGYRTTDRGTLYYAVDWGENRVAYWNNER